MQDKERLGGEYEKSKKEIRFSDHANYIYYTVGTA